MKGRKRLYSILSIMLLVLSFIGYAQEPPTTNLPGNNPNFDANKGFLWLTGHCPQGNCGNDIETTAFYTLALRDSGALDYAQQGLDVIKSKEDTTQHCWPAGGCKLKDTAFALWVLDQYGEDTSPIENYLKRSISAAPDLKDSWYLEVITSNNGTCKASYDTQTGNVQKDIPVSQGHFPSCPQSPVSTFFDLNNCLEANLLNRNPSLQIDINCNDLGPSTTLSVIFTKNSQYWIMQKSETPRQIFTIQNGCFGVTASSSCNLDTSLFSNWILFSTGSDITTQLFIKNKYDKFKTIDNALMYLSTNDAIKQQYLKDLVSLQRNDGSFNKQVFETAIAALALKGTGEGTVLSNAVSWLQSKQVSDGSWEDNELKTAAVLYAAFSGAAINLPPVTAGGPGETVFQCGNGVCDRQTENEQTCPDDCKTQTTTCQVNGICETAFEDTITCPQDCTCGDGICDNAELTSSSYRCQQDCQPASTSACGNGIVEGSEQCDISQQTGLGDDSQCPDSCQSDCSCPPEKTSGFGWWISIIIVVLLVGLIIFYLKMRGKGKSQPSARPAAFPFGFPSSPPRSPPPAQRPRPQAESKKSRIDQELDKSIEEAKKLLKKL